MQLSPYAIRTEDANGNTLFYNTYTQAFARMESTVEVDALAPDAQAVLAGLGILTEHPSEEPNRIAEHYAVDTKSNSALILLVAPTMECNFACPYCYEVETRHPGLMDAQTQDDLVAFIERERDRRGYKELQIRWYGGEPLMGISVIEALTPRLKALDMEYSASMTSNLSLATNDMIERMVNCDITAVMTTLDGIGEHHDTHRPSVSGAPSYERIRSAIDTLSQRGVKAIILYNLDRTNVDDYDALDEEFYGRENVMFLGSQIFDYCGRFDCSEDFCRPAYDLFTNPKENVNFQYERFMKKNPTPAAFAAQLAPTRIFCGRQIDGYFVVDEKGMLYECDGDIGYYDRAIGSVTDSPAPAHKPYNPLDDEHCTGCAFMPLCLGNCRWTRDCTGQSCIPYKWNINRLLADWAACCTEPVRSEAGVDVLNEPMSLKRFYATTFSLLPL